MNPKKLWKENKLLFIILLPIILIVVFKDLIIDLLIGSARKEVNKVKIEDKELKTISEEKQKEAERIIEEAKKLGEEAKNIEEDPDWHKKR